MDMPATPPLVTVITPTYNAAHCVARCIASVREQTWPAIEHIVIDGGSKDATVEVLKQAGVRHVSERDAGLYDAMSKGIRMARGEFVHILNADDRYSGPDALATLVAKLRDGQLDLVHGRARQVDEHGAEVCTFGRDVPKLALLRKMRVAHPTVVVRRAVYERYGAFSVGFRIAADHEFLLRVWDRIKVGFVPQVMVEMAIGGMSTDNANAVRAYRESMAAALLHGRRPLPALMRCHYEIVKHFIIRARKFRKHDHTDPRPLLVPVSEPVG